MTSLLDTHDLAKLFGCSKRLVELRVASGHIPRPMVLWNGCSRWREEDIRQWLENLSRRTAQDREMPSEAVDTEAQNVTVRLLFDNDTVCLTSTQ